MADLTGITAVQPASDSTVQKVDYGGTIGVGAPVYLNTATSKYEACVNSTAPPAAAVGIAVTAGVDTDSGVIITEGGVVLVGTTMTIGEPYVVSDTAGNIAPEPDLTTGDFVTRLGTASSATKLELSIKATGIPHG